MSANLLSSPASTKKASSHHLTGRWIRDWRPEDPKFWASTGSRVARRNLICSVFSEHLGFSVWLIWSVSSAFLLQMGFNFSPQQLFFLVALPNLVGSIMRIPYTLAVVRFGGRNWTVASSAMLLIPTLLFAYAVQHPGTPYWVFCLIAATAGFGGGNFASSMANINFFYPTNKKGFALGLNAAGGNLGVAIIQIFLPVMVGSAGVFGLVKASQSGISLQVAGYVYAGLAIIATVLAYLRMDNLESARSDAREQLQILRNRHTWIMSLLYIGTFGSFIGFSAAMPLLIKLNFWVPTPAPLGTGIYFAYYAFLGAAVGSLARPLGGRLADRIGGARVTIAAFIAMAVFTFGVLWTLLQLTPNPDADPAIATQNQPWFGWFLGFFMLVFAATGIGNGSTYKMIPSIWKRHADASSEPGSPAHATALLTATRQASAALGVIGAIGALGGFLIPLAFAAPWVADPASATKGAFLVFVGYYVLCAVITATVYLRRANPARKLIMAGV